MNFNRDEITVVLPCHNEERSLKPTVENLRNAGLNNIIVVDDASRDNSAKTAESLDVIVLKNYGNTNLNLAILKGIYNVKTSYALVAYNYYELVNPRLLEQFIEFGIMGNYSLLISKDESNKSKALSNIIKRKFGIFLHAPLFDIVFFDKKALDLIKREIGGTGSFVYFEIIKKIIDHNLKLGSYSLGLSSYKPKTFYAKARYLLRRLRKNENPETYFKYAVPDIDKKEIKKQVLIATSGYIIIRFFEWVLLKWG